MGESQGEREPHLARDKGSEQEHGEERVDSIMKEGRLQGAKGVQAKRTSLAEVEERMSGGVDAKALQKDLQSLGFTPSLAKPKMGKKFGRQRTR